MGDHGMLVGKCLACFLCIFLVRVILGDGLDPEGLWHFVASVCVTEFPKFSNTQLIKLNA